MIAFNAVDPTHTTALEFADFGSYYTPDGREHPITGQTPLAPLPTINEAVSTARAGAAAGAAAVAMSGPGDWVDKFFEKLKEKLMPSHLKARVIVGAIAVVVILLAAFRFASAPAQITRITKG